MPGSSTTMRSVADLLHHRLGDAELVDAIAHDLERAIDRLALVLAAPPLALVDLEREVHPALQVESLLERNALARRVVEVARLRFAFANRDRPRPEREDGRDHEHEMMRRRLRILAFMRRRVGNEDVAQLLTLWLDNG